MTDPRFPELAPPEPDRPPHWVTELLIIRFLRSLFT